MGFHEHLCDLSHKKWSNLRTFCRVYEMSKCARLETAHFTRTIERFYRDFTNFCDIYKWFKFCCVYLTYDALHQLKHLKEFTTFFVVVFAVVSAEFLLCLYPSEPVKV